jgi:uncharacterized protein YndB with AHSA1/START domain
MPTSPSMPPVAKAQMLIRKPVAQVFEALVDPAITSRFWFSKGSGRLEAGKHVRWGCVPTLVEIRRSLLAVRLRLAPHAA